MYNWSIPKLLLKNRPPEIMPVDDDSHAPHAPNQPSDYERRHGGGILDEDERRRGGDGIEEDGEEVVNLKEDFEGGYDWEEELEGC